MIANKRYRASLSLCAGTPGFVLANGSISSNQSGESGIRKSLIEDGPGDCAHRELSDEDITRITDTYAAWQGGEGVGDC